MANLQIQKNVHGQNFQVFLSDLFEHPREAHTSVERRFFYKGVKLADCSKMQVRKFEHFKKTYLESIPLPSPGQVPQLVFGTGQYFVCHLCDPQSLEETGSYGVAELNFLLQTYSSMVVSERALDDFPFFKRIVFSLRQLPYKDLCAKLVCENSDMHQSFPDFAILALLALVMPFGSELREKIH